MVSAAQNKKGRFLPKEFDLSHFLCFTIHDAMVQIIVSGESSNIFTTTIKFETVDEKNSFENSNDIFEWLDSIQRYKDRARILRTIVFPAVLSDMMHCVFECLECSRKGKLAVSYMLIRKPLQESLYLLEKILLDELDFAAKLATDPLQLRPHTAGGIEGHTKRIQSVLELLGEAYLLDANYIAQLRYDKNNYDSFDGICNHAMHLFTQHKAIQTEKLNINFIFSGAEEKLLQWAFLYSRLPYLLYYTHRIVEHITGRIALTTQEYIDDIDRRISAQLLLWWNNLDESDKCAQLATFIEKTRIRLNEQCQNSGYHMPNVKDLKRMASGGAYPGESMSNVRQRDQNRKKVIKLTRNKMNSKLDR